MRNDDLYELMGYMVWFIYIEFCFVLSTLSIVHKTKQSPDDTKNPKIIWTLTTPLSYLMYAIAMRHAV